MLFYSLFIYTCGFSKTLCRRPKDETKKYYCNIAYVRTLRMYKSIFTITHAHTTHTTHNQQSNNTNKIHLQTTTQIMFKSIIRTHSCKTFTFTHKCIHTSKKHVIKKKRKQNQSNYM